MLRQLTLYPITRLNKLSVNKSYLCTLLVVPQYHVISTALSQFLFALDITFAIASFVCFVYIIHSFIHCMLNLFRNLFRRVTELAMCTIR